MEEQAIDYKCHLGYLLSLTITAPFHGKIHGLLVAFSSNPQPKFFFISTVKVKTFALKMRHVKWQLTQFMLRPGDIAYLQFHYSVTPRRLDDTSCTLHWGVTDPEINGNKKIFENENLTEKVIHSIKVSADNNVQRCYLFRELEKITGKNCNSHINTQKSSSDDAKIVVKCPANEKEFAPNVCSISSEMASTTLDCKFQDALTVSIVKEVDVVTLLQTDRDKRKQTIPSDIVPNKVFAATCETSERTVPIYSTLQVKPSVTSNQEITSQCTGGKKQEQYNESNHKQHEPAKKQQLNLGRNERHREEKMQQQQLCKGYNFNQQQKHQQHELQLQLSAQKLPTNQSQHERCQKEEEKKLQQHQHLELSRQQPSQHRQHQKYQSSKERGNQKPNQHILFIQNQQSQLYRKFPKSPEQNHVQKQSQQQLIKKSKIFFPVEYQQLHTPLYESQASQSLPKQHNKFLLQQPVDIIVLQKGRQILRSDQKIYTIQNQHKESDNAKNLISQPMRYHTLAIEGQLVIQEKLEKLQQQINQHLNMKKHKKHSDGRFAKRMCHQNVQHHQQLQNHHKIHEKTLNNIQPTQKQQLQGKLTLNMNKKYHQVEPTKKQLKHTRSFLHSTAINQDNENLAFDQSNEKQKVEKHHHHHHQQQQQSHLYKKQQQQAQQHQNEQQQFVKQHHSNELQQEIEEQREKPQQIQINYQQHQQFYQNQSKQQHFPQLCDKRIPIHPKQNAQQQQQQTKMSSIEGNLPTNFIRPTKQQIIQSTQHLSSLHPRNRFLNELKKGKQISLQKPRNEREKTFDISEVPNKSIKRTNETICSNQLDDTVYENTKHCDSTSQRLEDEQKPPASTRNDNGENVNNGNQRILFNIVKKKQEDIDGRENSDAHKTNLNNSQLFDGTQQQTDIKSSPDCVLDGEWIHDALSTDNKNEIKLEFIEAFEHVARKRIREKRRLRELLPPTKRRKDGTAKRCGELLVELLEILKVKYEYLSQAHSKPKQGYNKKKSKERCSSSTNHNNKNIDQSDYKNIDNDFGNNTNRCCNDIVCNQNGITKILGDNNGSNNIDNPNKNNNVGSHCCSGIINKYNDINDTTDIRNGNNISKNNNNDIIILAYHQVTGQLKLKMKELEEEHLRTYENEEINPRILRQQLWLKSKKCDNCGRFGDLPLCGGCLRVSYCNRPCQIKAWRKKHHSNCR